MVVQITRTTGAYAVYFSMGELGAFHVHFNLLCPKTRALRIITLMRTKRVSFFFFFYLWEAAADLCPTPSGRSRRGIPGCPSGPSPRGAAAERAASAGAAAPVLKSPAGTDSFCPSLQVSEEQNEEELTGQTASTLIITVGHHDLNNLHHI